jgi:hypothetical protein
MEKVFRTSLVDQISIQLDKEGLNGLDVKEELVLISDQLVQLDKQMVSSTESLGQKIDDSKEYLVLHGRSFSTVGWAPPTTPLWWAVPTLQG